MSREGWRGLGFCSFVGGREDAVLGGLRAAAPAPAPGPDPDAARGPSGAGFDPKARERTREERPEGPQPRQQRRPSHRRVTEDDGDPDYRRNNQPDVRWRRIWGLRWAARCAADAGEFSTRAAAPVRRAAAAAPRHGAQPDAYAYPPPQIARGPPPQNMASAATASSRPRKCPRTTARGPSAAARARAVHAGAATRRAGAAVPAAAAAAAVRAASSSTAGAGAGAARGRGQPARRHDARPPAGVGGAGAGSLRKGGGRGAGGGRASRGCGRTRASRGPTRTGPRSRNGMWPGPNVMPRAAARGALPAVAVAGLARPARASATARFRRRWPSASRSSRDGGLGRFSPGLPVCRSTRPGSAPRLGVAGPRVAEAKALLSDVDFRRLGGDAGKPPICRKMAEQRWSPPGGVLIGSRQLALRDAEALGPAERVATPRAVKAGSPRCP